MPELNFYLSGEPITSSKHLDVDPIVDLSELRALVAAHFAIIQPEGT